MNNKRIFLTGGTGFLGKEIIKKYINTNEITVYSRDEAKQYYLKKQFPSINCVCGDVRNYDLMYRVSKNHDIGIFTASFKQIESCHDNYEEANQVIVNGSFNSRRCSEENNFESACFISSDKSRSATTIYGAMKYVAGESFISNFHKSNVKLTTAIYGNVLNSTGSIIPLIWDTIKNSRTLQLYSKEMTRFVIDVEEAVDLIEKSLSYSGYNIIPHLNSIKIIDLFEIYKEEFGLKYTISSPRSCEKIHEIMASGDEISRMKKEDGMYLMSQQKIYGELSFKDNQFSSKDFVMPIQQLNILLKRKNYYNPL